MNRLPCGLPGADRAAIVTWLLAEAVKEPGFGLDWSVRYRVPWTDGLR